MVKTQSDDMNTECCKACGEPIRSGVDLCYHCGSVQKPPSVWKKVSNTLKWIGGVITVISLLTGTVTLAGYYQDWQEQRDAVADLVDAADWLIKAKNYSQAWQMYEEALTLNPSSEKVFLGQLKLAQIWLRDFVTNKDKVDETIDRITAILYRGLRSTDSDKKATILAHVGKGQSIRKENRLPVFVDVDTVFQEALRASPENVYANAMLGYWILLKRGVSAEDIALAQSKFAVALKNQDKRAYVHRLQFSSLVGYTYGWDDEVEQAALKVLLRESFSMMKKGEPKPYKLHRHKILDAYGLTGRAEHVEASIGFLPPADHLAVHEWLMDGLDYSNGRMLAQARYVKARLIEAMGKKQEALAQYQSLLGESDATKQLNSLVDKGIARLTGSLPERALARTYFDDPVDENDPWNFHLDTLAHFDPMWQPNNFKQSMEYFASAVALSDKKLPELIEVLAKTFQRIWKIVREGDDIALHNNYTSGFGMFEHVNARQNLFRLTYVYARALTTTGKLDKAIAVLDDMKKLTDKLDDKWPIAKARMTFELARAYAVRAWTRKNKADSASALKFLRKLVEDYGVNGDITTWDEIKSDTFKGIRDDPGYKELIRGR